jgi:hypothetical protein
MSSAIDQYERRAPMLVGRNHVQDWREADALAREAETRLKRAWGNHEAGGPRPSERLLEDVARLRQDANDKLRVAMQRVGATGFNR